MALVTEAKHAEPAQAPKGSVGRLLKRLHDAHFKWKYGVSKALFSTTVGGNTPLLRIMEKLRVTEREATSFLRLFEKIDADHSGSIDLEEFFVYFRLDRNRFIERAFNVMDFDRDGDSRGELNYTEFFISLYNFCTLNRDTLVRFTFQVCDQDGSGSISREELFDMVELLHEHRGQQKTQAETGKILNILDANKDGHVSMNEFIRCSRQIGSMMFPAFRLQKKMRSRTMNSTFWSRATRQRLDMDRDGVNDLIQLYHTTIAEIDAAKERERIKKLEEEANARQLVELQTREISADELEKIEQEIEDLFEGSAHANEEQEDLDGEDADASAEDAALAPVAQDPRKGHRSGEWWDEQGGLEDSPAQEPPDAPQTASRNLPRAHEKLLVDERTADTLEFADARRLRALQLRQKAIEAHQEIADLRQLIDNAERRKVEDAEDAEILAERRKQRPSCLGQWCRCLCCCCICVKRYLCGCCRKRRRARDARKVHT